jgi:membrane-associated phospholipid phosphatase
MDIFWPLDLNITLIFQSLGSWLIIPMKFFSALGLEEFYTLILPLLYWCVDAVIGLRIGSMLLISTNLYGFLKRIFAAPRPFWLDSRVQAHITETSFGFPSGHAQNAASIWGLAAQQFKRRWFTITTILLILMIGFSRVFLGVHGISQVVAGWLAGTLLLLAYMRWQPGLMRWFLRQHQPSQYLLVLASSAILVLIPWLVNVINAQWTLPTLWQANASLADPELILDPFNPEGLISVGGTWLGMFTGALWFYHRFGIFNTAGHPGIRTLRYLIGLVGVVLLWYGLGSVLPDTIDLVGLGLRYLRYTLVGLWVSALAPLVFLRLRVAVPPQTNTAESG